MPAVVQYLFLCVLSTLFGVALTSTDPGHSELEIDHDGLASPRKLQLTGDDLDPDEQLAQKAIEYHAMMQMYSSCANHSLATYSRKAGWGDPELSNWYGLTLDDGGFLTAIDLSSSHLKCEIPSEIGGFRFLESLVLSNNELTGTVPTAIGLLTKLHTLNLMKQRNKLVGSIPSEIGELTNLRYLDLSYNSITMAIPSSIGSLTKLEILELSNNFINGTFPASLANLQNLEVFNMKHNELTSDVAHLYELLPQFELDTANTKFWMSNIFNAGGEQSAIFQENDV